MNDPTLSGPASETSEPASFADNVKNLFKKHKGKILAVGGVVVSVALAAVAIRLAEGQDTEPSPGPVEAERSKRPSPVGHEVAATLVKLAPGQQASEERRAAYKEEMGEDLPAGCTYRSKYRRGDFEGNETPGEVAA
ncbi:MULTISPECIES: hypothetical protein [unclassified Streptomyces]|uniref:hypothetical protein n=1 Tax=unclassified Streptomyces TaxID=2593676 RepID=UPI00131B644C|nr:MULTISPECIES: hypothetical protein [unclassified Streptomyces]